MNDTIAVYFSVDDAHWLDRWMQMEYKREGFRPHESRKPEVVRVGDAVQEAIATHTKGVSEQDQIETSIAETWRKTTNEMKDEFLSWLEEDDLNMSVTFVRKCPPEWIDFVQRCCAAGLRGAVMDDHPCP